ncbi:MAG TPA: TetR/AcrR family transcriptional regulator [Oligoflexia bacterium]|nr:TetR/AcrR family transcriptional regulator [Oligoflexia bacterium]HMP27877.1 TetR/AcrR family transcriptional regulator [Oligoflexia bacterium]
MNKKGENNNQTLEVERETATEPRGLSATSKNRVLAAALKLFVEQGYFNTNIPDLSRESKCSVGSIYHHFKNKEEVAKELYAQCIADFRRSLASALEEAKSPEAVIKTLVHSLLHFSEVNKQLSRYMWLCRHNEFVSAVVKPATVVGFDSLGRKLTTSIRGGIKQRQLRALSAHLIWSILFGIPLAYVRDWLEGLNPLSPTEVADEIAEACWRALKA